MLIYANSANILTNLCVFMLRFSILIPTYNRKEKLNKVLEALSDQEGIDRGEIIVGVDGSEDGTEEWLDSHSSVFNFQLSIFSIKNSGRAVIRNKLLDRAKGEIIIFIQDDIIVDTGWLKAHLESHKKAEGAVLGFMTWYPQMELTPYMKWLENGGHMLDYAGLKDGQETDFWHFYMGNMSIPNKLIGSARFYENLKIYGWEDIIFGYQFVSKGNKVYYRNSARAYHWHEYRADNLGEYMKKIGESAAVAESLYPGLGFVPDCRKKLVFYFLIYMGKLFRSLIPQNWKWYLDMKEGFLRAVEEKLG